MTSDVPPMMAHTREVTGVEERQVAGATSHLFCLTGLTSNIVKRKSQPIDWSPVLTEKGSSGNFMHHTFPKESHE